MLKQPLFISHHFLWDSVSKTSDCELHASAYSSCHHPCPSGRADRVEFGWQVTIQQHSFLLLELGQTMTARGWWSVRRHLPSRRGQEVLSSVANLLFAKNFRNFMRMHTDIKDDVTSLLMWNVCYCEKASRCRRTMQGHGVGGLPGFVLQCTMCIRIAVSGPRALDGKMNTGMLCDGLWNCKEKDLQSERLSNRHSLLGFVFLV